MLPLPARHTSSTTLKKGRLFRKSTLRVDIVVAVNTIACSSESSYEWRQVQFECEPETALGDCEQFGVF